MALYDPSAVSRELAINESDQPLSAKLRAALTDGSLTLVRIADDCEASIAVYFDEEPPESLLSAADSGHLSEASLSIPTGILASTGAEDIATLHEQIEPGTFATAQVPAGDYRLNAFSTIHWKLENRRIYLAEHTSTIQRRMINATDTIGIAAAFMLVGSFFGVPALAFAALQFRWSWAWKALALLIVADVTLYALIRFTEHLSSKHPEFSMARGVIDDFERQYPDIVVVLESSSSPTAGRVPAILSVAA